MILSIGDKSLQCVRLQLYLRATGHYKGLIDGEFADDTLNACMAYQRSAGLVVDGLFGSNSWASIIKAAGRKMCLLFIHCAASPEGLHVPAANVITWHTMPKPKGRGWDRCGYSDIIELDGSLHNTRSFDQDDMISSWEETWGVHGSTLLNANARHVCYIGGLAADNKTVKDTRTSAQKETLDTYVRFMLLRYPNLVIAGHNQVQFKGCPSFDVPNYLGGLGVKEYNIANWGKMYK